MQALVSLTDLVTDFNTFGATPAISRDVPARIVVSCTHEWGHRSSSFICPLLEEHYTLGPATHCTCQV